MNRRMPNGTYGGVRGWGREAPAYSISLLILGAGAGNMTCFLEFYFY